MKVCVQAIWKSVYRKAQCSWATRSQCHRHRPPRSWSPGSPPAGASQTHPSLEPWLGPVALSENGGLGEFQSQRTHLSMFNRFWLFLIWRDVPYPDSEPTHYKQRLTLPPTESAHWTNRIHIGRGRMTKTETWSLPNCFQPTHWQACCDHQSEGYL